jgi:hypothetical protein
MPSRRTVAFLSALALALGACAGSTSLSPQRPAAQGHPPQGYPPQGYPPQGYPPQGYLPQGYPPQGYPPQGYPPQGYPPQGYPQGYPPQQPPPAASAQPTLPGWNLPGLPGLPGLPSGPPPIGSLQAPLVGVPAMQAETRAVLEELIRNLRPDLRAKVQGIPLLFENDPTEVNAFAGCQKGSAYMAGTQGILLAVDALAQTHATDQLFGTRTYEAYLQYVLPRMLKQKAESPELPAGLIPPQHQLDPRRLSLARDIFGDVMAFTFGHELAHHYLDHTGCANGAQAGLDLATGWRVLSTVVEPFNQPNELAADNFGLFNVMDAGKARVPRYRWTERGGMILLDFFARLESAAGMNPLNPIGFLRSHPNSQLRKTVVQNFAAQWRAQHPGS